MLYKRMASGDERKLPHPPSPIAGATPAAAVPDWNRIAASADFQRLTRAKRRFIIPATIFFVVYYFALPYLVGYHPELMQRKVWREMNWAYLFALSQFFMAWILAALYVVNAARWDRQAQEIIEGHRR